jgi:hypothetical protein
MMGKFFIEKDVERRMVAKNVKLLYLWYLNLY